MKSEQFCEGCPIANGVVEADKIITRGFTLTAPNPGFEISFAENDDVTVQTSRFRVTAPNSGVSSRWPHATAEEILRRVEACEHPKEEVRTGLSRLLGSTVVQRCGAFPEENPKKPRIVARG